MYRVWQGITIIFVIVLQTTLSAYFGLPSGIRPDFILIMVIYFGVSRGPLEGEVIGFISGLLEDAFGGGGLGINALTKTIIGFLSGIIKKDVYFENIISQGAIISMATLIDTFLRSLIRVAISTRAQIEISTLPLRAFYNTLTGIIIFQVLLMIKRRREQRGKNDLSSKG